MAASLSPRASDIISLPVYFSVKWKEEDCISGLPKGLNEATEQSALWKGILGKTLAPFSRVSSRARLLSALGLVLGLLGPPPHRQAILGPSSESGLGTGCAVNVTVALSFLL